MSCRTNCCKKLSLTFALLAMAIVAAPAFGQAGTCMQDEYNAFNGTSSTLVCTANDVSVAAVTGTTIISGGVGNSCLQGSMFTFVADFTILTTSNKTRSNIGLFFGTGQSNALTGTCSDSILTPTYTCPGTGPGTSHPAAVTCGDPSYEELDQAINAETSPNGCGDTSSTDNGNGTQLAELEVGPITCPTTTVPCPPGTPGGITTCMALPECTSWFQPTTTMPVCNSPTHAWVPQAIPGTKSKCSCTTLYIPVQPITPSVTVAKSCNIPPDTTAGLTSCDAGEEGHDVVYTVTVTNTTPANEGGVVVDQICDDQYGNVFTATGFGGNACPAGGTGTVVSTTCPPADIANGSSGSCTFTVHHGENLSVTDTVTIKGHSDLVSTSLFGPASSGTVTVTSSDEESTATTTKGLAPGPQAACVTLRYNVTVANTSTADESVTLNSVPAPGYIPALNDNAYGDLSMLHGSASVDGSIVGTTCGIPGGSSGLGTLSTVTANTFPATLAPGTNGPPSTDGGTYKCQFDGVICGTPSPIPPPPATATCAFGLTKPDTVLAHLTGDDIGANADTITQTDNPFTASVCLVQQ